MKVPYTVPTHVLAAYKCSPETLQSPREQARTLRAEDLTWDDGRIPELRTLALRAIVSNWKEEPIFDELPSCEERDALIELLPTDLPFELAITRIDNEHYWKRCAVDRWDCNDPSEHGDSWRRLYCERHLAEYLESLEASFFEPQRDDCEQLMNLLKDYVRTVRVRSLVPTKKPSPWMKGEDEDECLMEEDVVHHIPMGVILPLLPNLKEISLNFGMIYMNDGFEWRAFEFSVEDCKSLGQGLKELPNLRRFSLTRSNLDQPRAASLLQELAKNETIEELDLSHCKLADRGAHAVGEFLSMHSQLTTVHLANNNIGPSGVAGIVYGLVKASFKTSLKHLDLRLNPLGDTGAHHICALLLRNDTVEVLDISCCSLTSEGGLAIAEVVSSGHLNIPYLTINLSNNDLGTEAGTAFETAVKAYPYVVDLDTRMCHFSNESEHTIHESSMSTKAKWASKVGLKDLHQKSSAQVLSQQISQKEGLISRKMAVRAVRSDSAEDIGEEMDSTKLSDQDDYVDDIYADVEADVQTDDHADTPADVPADTPADVPAAVPADVPADVEQPEPPPVTTEADDGAEAGN